MTISIAEVRALVPFEEVYRRHAGSVHRFCLSQVCDQTVAEDLTHETFVRAFVAYERARPDLDAVRAWLLTIARNLCVDHHRRHGRWRRLLARMAERPGPPAGPDVEVVAQRKVDLARVTAALAMFRERERQLIGMRVAADLSYREIAQVLRISEAAAKAGTHRAITKLRALLENAS
jgi:RNA polymerase sigma-70 factor (ECF subfamily)